MDILTIQWGWIGGNPVAVTAPPTTTPAVAASAADIHKVRIPIGLELEEQKRREEEELLLL